MSEVHILDAFRQVLMLESLAPVALYPDLRAVVLENKRDAIVISEKQP